MFKTLWSLIKWIFGGIYKGISGLWKSFWVSIFGRLFEGGVLENYTEMPVDSLTREYGIYLMENEEIQIGFKLVRDALIFTNKRIILTDQIEATGVRMRIESINLYSVVAISMETAGLNFDDCELTFKYISSPHIRGYNIEYKEHTLKFPTNYDVQSLYIALQDLAYKNCIRINNLD